MFKFAVENEVIYFVEKLLKKHNFGRRGFADGNYNEQVTGLIGQTVIQEFFNRKRPSGEGGFDGGVDLEVNGNRIDVKTMGRNVDPRPDYVNNFIGLQKNYDTDLLLFCSYNKRTKNLTVCGWISKVVFIKNASFFPLGTPRFRSDGTSFITKADLYELENSELIQSSSIEELVLQIQSL